MSVNADSIQARLDEIDKQESKLIDLYQLGIIPLETINMRLKDLLAEKSELQKELQKEKEPESGVRFLSTVAAYRNGFRDGGTDEKRMLLSSIVERVVIDGQSVKVYWRI